MVFLLPLLTKEGVGGRLSFLAASLLLVLASNPAAAQNPAAPPSSPPPSITLDYEHIIGSLSDAILEGTETNPVRLDYGGELTIQAQRVAGNLVNQHYEASGKVHIHDADTTLDARSFLFDGPANTGTMTYATLSRAPYTLRARQIIVMPGVIAASDADFTTVPPDVRPDYSIRAGSILLYPARRRVSMRRVTFYAFQRRLFTIPAASFGFGLHRGGLGDSLLPMIGVNGRSGPYATINGLTTWNIPVLYHLQLSVKQSPELRLTGSQTPITQPEPPRPAANPGHRDYLGALRQFATAGRSPLPPGDPLLFHDFTGAPNTIQIFRDLPGRSLNAQEVLALHEQANGRRRDDLYVSRLPEVSATGVVPILAREEDTETDDAHTVRRKLRRFAFSLVGQATAGDYNEQPERAHHTREQIKVDLTARPYLIGANTVVLPRVTWTANHYSGVKSSYRYTQFSIAASHYFSDRAGIGVNYIVSSSAGDSPFNFDVLDTTGELDGRAQLGNHKFTVSFLERYDLVRHGVIAYQVALAPGFRGITPVVTYDSRRRAFIASAEVEGVTF